MKFSFANIESIYELIQELMTGFTRLSFDDNFESFEVKDLKIGAGLVKSIPNSLTEIPSKYIIVSQTGSSVISKTTTDKWNKNTLYLKNNGIEDVTLNIVFIK